MGILSEYPIANLRDCALQWQEIAPPSEPLIYVERGTNVAFKYGQAHAFLCRVEGARVIGSGSLFWDGKLLVHGLSTGNYRGNIEQQLGHYQAIPDGGEIEDECVLCWGTPNFGHWVITYLLRLTNLWHKTELLTKPLLLPQSLPKKYVEWLRRMGFERLIFASDGVKVRSLWIPSVICYRGHYEDKLPYVYPPSVHLLRQRILKDLELPHPVKERIYVSRSRAQWRRLVNEEEVVSMLKRNGIRRVYLEEMSLEYQLDLMSRAELILIHFGGGSPTTMFAPYSARIVEIAAPNIAGSFGSRCWAHILGQKFSRIDANPVAKTGLLATDWDAEVDVDALEKML